MVSGSLSAVRQIVPVGQQVSLHISVAPLLSLDICGNMAIINLC